jgi:hypothetical protein
MRRHLMSLALRLHTHRVRLGATDGILLNLSATGALVRVPIRLAIGIETPLAIDANERPVRLRCRVVRCAETAAALDGAAWRRTQFDATVAFEEPAALTYILDLIDRRRA